TAVSLPQVIWQAGVGWQGLLLTWASATRKSLIRPSKNNDFKAAGSKIALDALVQSPPLASNQRHPSRSPTTQAGGWRPIFPATASRDPPPPMLGVARDSAGERVAAAR